METSELTLKKGATIYMVSCHNYHYGQPRDKGATIDKVNIQKLIIHSIGKKLMRLMNEKGEMWQHAFYLEHVNKFPQRQIVSTFEQALTKAQQIHKSDKHRLDLFEVVQVNMCY